MQIQKEEQAQKHLFELRRQNLLQVKQQVQESHEKANKIDNVELTIVKLHSEDMQRLDQQEKAIQQKQRELEQELLSLRLTRQLAEEEHHHKMQSIGELKVKAQDQLKKKNQEYKDCQV